MDRVRVVRGPKENRHRPAVDVLFRSAALAYGTQVIGIVLTGSLDDGTAGLLAIKQRGGLAIVQNPEDALYQGMPRSALQNVPVDHVIPLSNIPGLLATFTQQNVIRSEALPVSAEMQSETRIAQMDKNALDHEETIGKPSAIHARSAAVSCGKCRMMSCYASAAASGTLFRRRASWLNKPQRWKRHCGRHSKH